MARQRPRLLRGEEKDMKTLKRLLRNKIIVFLLIVLGFFVLAKSLIKPQESPLVVETPKPTIPPAFRPKPTPVFKPTAPSQTTMQKIIAQLPYKSESFEVSYYQKTKKFAVTITSGPIEETMKEAGNWFYTQGIQDLSQIQILWQPTREVLEEAGVQRPIPAP